MKKYSGYFKLLRPEAIIWIAGLALLAFLAYQPLSFSVCPFHNLGITFCPGCGLGASIGYLFKLDISSSFAAHPLGIPSFLIITHRIFTLFIYSHYFAERKTNG